MTLPVTPMPVPLLVSWSSRGSCSCKACWQLHDVACPSAGRPPFAKVAYNTISLLYSCRSSSYFHVSAAVYANIPTPVNCLPGAFANVWKLDCALHLAPAIYMGCLCDCSPNQSYKGSRQATQAVLGPVCRRLRRPDSQQVLYWTGYTAPMLLPCLNKTYLVGLSSPPPLLLNCYSPFILNSHQTICVKTFWDCVAHDKSSLLASASVVHKMHMFHVHKF